MHVNKQTSRSSRLGNLLRMGIHQTSRINVLDLRKPLISVCLEKQAEPPLSRLYFVCHNQSVACSAAIPVSAMPFHSLLCSAMLSDLLSAMLSALSFIACLVLPTIHRILLSPLSYATVVPCLCGGFPDRPVLRPHRSDSLSRQKSWLSRRGRDSRPFNRCQCSELLAKVLAV